ncbi:MAG: DUF11 domain-containing protein [Rhodothermales bacterium]|nr:DUF11 domain-containing protein [Rhodothermales bacterium]
MPRSFYALVLLLAVTASAPPAAAQRGLSDLAAQKRAQLRPVEVGAPARFYIAVTNHGPDAAADVVLIDPLPEGLAFVAAAPSHGTFDPETGAWHLDALGVGETATLMLTTTLEREAPVENCALVRHQRGADPDASNDADCATVYPLPSLPPSPSPTRCSV